MQFPSAILRHPLITRRNLPLAGGALLTLLLSGIAFSVYSSRETYATAQAVRGPVTQKIEAVGTVISEQDLQLQFRSPGIVSEVLVQEGDVIRAGQRLAALRAGDIGASVAAAAARVQEAEAALRAMQEGTRPEEITIAEAQLDSKRMSLESAKTVLSTAEANLTASQDKLSALQQEANTALSSQIAMAGTIASQKLTTAEQSLSAIDDVMGTYGISDITTQIGSSAYAALRSQVSDAKFALQSAKREPIPDDKNAAVTLMDQSHSAIQQAIDSLTSAYDFIGTLPDTRGLSRDDREMYKNTIATKRSNAQAALTELDTWSKGLKDAAAVYDTRIATEEGNLASAKGAKEKAEIDIRSFEISIRIDEANLALKKAGPRQTDIDAARARWNAARADLARAGSSYGDTQIIAPIAGRITKISIKAGEMTPIGSAITMMGDSPYRIEAFLSEADIMKVQFSQSGSIELDAFPGTHYQLIVGEIDEAPTMINGGEKYRIKLDFLYPHTELKISMSGDLTIVTDTDKDALLIPAKAIRKTEKGTTVRVLNVNDHVTETSVTTGIHDAASGLTEITSGLQAGDTVILPSEQ
ncbi:MAG: efflux RND transporter periplasmic adaptor subunit [Candidatus Peribacteraceae bacterium]|nr:efflux RND transporter periplasmic adaptor subunit [Candidatus Peribacteraceae bacterium]